MVSEETTTSSVVGESDVTASCRRSICILLMTVSVGLMIGRILAIESGTRGPNGQRTPFLSANDRSRWCTVRALVDQGTYEIDKLVDGKDANWRTIDRVKHRGSDGIEHSYSSKPPLLPTLLAIPYYVIQKTTGATLGSDPLYVGRLILMLSNVLPMVLYFVLMACLVEKTGRTNWGRIFVLTACFFGTFLSTFAVTINNHLVAAISVLISIYVAWRIWYDKERSWWLYVVAGISSAFAVANELPALSFFCLLGAGLCWSSPRKMLLGFVPGAALVATCFFVTNYYAHQSWRPPYMHRSDGSVLGSWDLSEVTELNQSHLSVDLAEQLAELKNTMGSDTTVQVDEVDQRWVIVNSRAERELVIVRAENHLEIRDWDNWYDYEGTYWTNQNRKGVDRGEKSVMRYAFHMLVGHHGVLSLTPVWLVSLAGCLFGLRQKGKPLLALVVVVGTLTIVCVVFYMLRPQIDRNYGGVCCGFRWLFWLTPLWLLVMVPAADAMAKRCSTRILGVCFLGISIMSANATLNPWNHPWIYRYLKYLGW